MTHRSSRPGPLALLLALALLLVGCGGAAPAPRPPSAPFVAAFPDDTPGSGGVPGTPTPPPAGLAPFFDTDAFVHERTALFGSFPSDLVRFGNTIFTVDADQIEADGATVTPLDAALPLRPSTEGFLPVAIRAEDLVDDQGHAGSLSTPVGFGFFVNDLLVVSDRLGFAVVNAGGSDSAPALSNLIAFDPTAGRIVQVVDLARRLADDGQYVDSEGEDVPDSGFVQSGAEALAYVPSVLGRGRLYVAMTNLVFGPPSYGSVKYPGTLLVFDVDPAGPTPVHERPRGGRDTETIVVQGYNPVALTLLGSGRSRSRLLVTIAGATRYDDAYRLVPATPAAVEVYDAISSAYEGRFELGRTGLAAARPALGQDGAGHQVGFFPSAVTGEIYLLRLDGLYDDPIDPARLAVLRGPHNGIGIETAHAGGPGGNVTGTVLLDGGRFLAVAGFGDLFAHPSPRPGRLYLLALPDDVVTGSGFGANFVPGATLHATTPGRAFGAVTAGEGTAGRPDLYVNVSGGIDAVTYGGISPGSVGALWLRGLAAD